MKKLTNAQSAAILYDIFPEFAPTVMGAMLSYCQLILSDQDNIRKRMIEEKNMFTPEIWFHQANYVLKYITENKLNEKCKKHDFIHLFDSHGADAMRDSLFIAVAVMQGYNIEEDDTEEEKRFAHMTKALFQ